MKVIPLNNIQLSSQVIVFDQDTRQGQLSITNKHSTLGVIFKIKATKLNIIQVKPAKGFIKPMSKEIIHFKIHSNLSQQEMEHMDKNDKFLIQFLNIVNQQTTRQEVQNIWKAHKQGTANLEYGYGCYRVYMNLTGKKVVFASTIKSRSDIPSRMLQSAIKSSNFAEDDMKKSSSGMKNTRMSSSTSNNENELSKKYEYLKQKQEQLAEKRQKIFFSNEMSSSTKVGQSKKMNVKVILILIVFFILAFLGGNYTRSKMYKPKPVKQQQKSWIYNLLPFLK